MTMTTTIKNNNVFSSNYDKNVDWQINQLHRAICLYAEDYKIKKKLYKYILKSKELKLMQPLALKPFAKTIYKHLNKNIAPNIEGKYIMFTLVTGFYFGKNNWNMNFQHLQKETKKLLKGYDYIATVALDEFPREKYLDQGTLMSWHVHGILFEKPSRWNISQINKKVKRKGHNIIPFKTSSYSKLIDAIYYAFKAPFGGKVKRSDNNFMRTKLPLCSYYDNLIKLQNYPIYFGMFAGGKGKTVLNNILEEITNDNA